MKYLIVGGSSVAGQNTIKVIQNTDPDAEIISTSSADKDVAGAKHTVHFVDLNKEGAVATIAKDKEATTDIDVLIYCPAFGPVGFPVEDAQPEHWDAALEFSVNPIIELDQKLRPKKIVVFSSFYWLPHITIAYGGMAAAKLSLEYLATQDPRYRVVRLGTFFSNSLRGICLLIYRELRSTPNKRLQDVREGFKKSGMRFPPYFFQFAHGWEKETFSGRFATPHRETNDDDIQIAVRKVLTESDAPILNQIGDWQWEENDLPNLPEELAGVDGFIRNKYADVTAG